MGPIQKTMWSLALASTQLVTAQIPSLAWARAFKADGYDNSGRSIALDPAGNLVVVGALGGGTVDLDPGPGVSIDTVGSSDPFIVKLDNNGKFLWGGTFRQTNPADWAYASVVKFDPYGNILVGGSFADTMDIDPGPGIYPLISPDNSWSVFLAKFTSGGNLIWAESFQNLTDVANVECSTTNIYVTGVFRGTADFDPGPSLHTKTSAGGFDIYLLSLGLNGNFQFERTIGGPAYEACTDLVLKPNGSVILSGLAQDTCDLDPSSSAFLISPPEYAQHGFLAEFDPLGNFVMGGEFPGAVCGINAIELDASGNLILGGVYNGTVDFDPGPGSTTLSTYGYGQYFLASYDVSWNLNWINSSSSGYDSKGTYMYDLKTDAAGNIYSFGNFFGQVDFDPSPSVDSLYSKSTDMYIMKTTANGHYQWAFSFGGPTDSHMHYPDDLAGEIAVDNTGAIYTTGRCTYTTDFDPSPSALVVSDKENDAFIYKLNSSTITNLNGQAIVSSVYFYPNPTHNCFHLNSEAEVLRVNDSYGTEVYPTILKETIDLSELSSGVYLITLRSPEGIVIKKVVKE